MPQVARVHNRRRRLQLIVGISALALMVVVAVVAFVLNARWQAEQQALDHYQVVKSEAQILDNQGKYTEEVTWLTTYINSKPPKKYQYAFLIKLGDLTYNAIKPGDHAYNVSQDKAAEAWYMKAEAINGRPGLEDVLGVAQAAEGAGENSTAIKYYKTAITMTQQDNSGDQGKAYLISTYQQSIKALGGTP